MPAEFLEAKDAVTGAELIAASLIEMWMQVDGTSKRASKDALVTLLAQYFPELVGGNLVVDNVILKAGNTATLNGISLPTASLSIDTTRKELVAGDGTAGGYRPNSMVKVEPTLTPTVSYDIPQLGRDTFVFVSDLTGALGEGAFRLPTGLKIGDRFRVFIQTSSGLSLTNQYVFYNSDLHGDFIALYVLAPDFTAGSGVATDLHGLKATADGYVYFDITYLRDMGGNAALFVQNCLVNCEWSE